MDYNIKQCTEPWITTKQLLNKPFHCTQFLTLQRSRYLWVSLTTVPRRSIGKVKCDLQAFRTLVLEWTGISAPVPIGPGVWAGLDAVLSLPGIYLSVCSHLASSIITTDRTILIHQQLVQCSKTADSVTPFAYKHS